MTPLVWWKSILRFCRSMWVVRSQAVLICSLSFVCSVHQWYCHYNWWILVELSFRVHLFSSKCLNLMQICTIPLDTAKVRLQLQKKAVAGDGVALPKYKGLLGTVGTIAREEGLSALWKGIVPGLHRQCLFGGLRIGLYEPVSFGFFLTRTWCKFLCFVCSLISEMVC